MQQYKLGPYENHKKSFNSNVINNGLTSHNAKKLLQDFREHVESKGLTE